MKLLHFYKWLLLNPCLVHCWLTGYPAANICPVFKKGNRNSASNYQPISLNSLCQDYGTHHLSSTLIKTIFQWKPTWILIKTPLCYSANWRYILYALDHQKQIDVIFLDFTKAFDSVPHQWLLTRIRHYEINYSTLTWIEHWLTRCTQCEVLGGETSNSVLLLGVPLGTVLGPLMFALYLSIYMFACRWLLTNI